MKIICYLLLMFFLAGSLYSKEMTLEDKLKSHKLNVRYYDLFGKYLDMTVAKGFLNFMRNVNKRFPNLHVKIYIAPDAALSRASTPDDPNKAKSLYEYLKTFCDESGLSLKITDKILISMNKNIVMKFSDKYRKILSQTPTQIEYNIILMKKIPDDILVARLISDNTSSKIECNNKIYTDIPSLISYLKTIKTNGVFFKRTDKRGFKSDQFFFKCIVAYTYINNLELYTNVVLSISHNHEYREYIFK